MRVADAYNDSSDHSTTDNSSVTGGARNAGVFGDGAVVASSTLSSYVTGVTVTFSGREGDGVNADNSLRNGGSAFQNFAGMQALNQNTGAGASQNASVSVAASTGDIGL